MLTWIIGIYSLYIMLKIYLSVMQIGYINTEKRKKAVLMPQGRYIVAGNYAVAKEKLSIVESFVEYLLFLFWILYGFRTLQSIVGHDMQIVSNLLFLLLFFALNYILTLPLDIYSRFKIDKEFGFSKVTPKIYILDSIKSILLFIVIGGVLLGLLLWIVSNMREWWFYGFLLLFVTTLGANLLYPTLIAPIFNKFTPLADGELKRDIEKMMSDAGLESDGIFVMDASRRDSRLNAYFGGLGKSKRVVLFDTLLQKLDEKELLAVLGHELGHYSHGDIWKNISMTGIFLFVVFYLFGHIPQSLYIELGTIPTPAMTIALIVSLLPVAGFVYTPIMSTISRHNEYAADEYGAADGRRESLVSALLKLVSENKSFPRSDPLYSRFYHTHPPIIERLERLGFDSERVDFDATPPKEGIFSFLEREESE